MQNCSVVFCKCSNKLPVDALRLLVLSEQPKSQRYFLQYKTKNNRKYKRTPLIIYLNKSGNTTVWKYSIY